MCSSNVDSLAFDLMAHAYLAVSLAVLVLALGACVYALRSRWARSRALARLAVGGGVLALGVGFVFLVVGVGSIAAADAASKATALAVTISCAMNCGVFAVIGTPIGVALWVLSRRKLKASSVGT